MNKELTGYASYYEPGDSTGSTEWLAMRTLKTCPDCEGSGKIVCGTCMEGSLYRRCDRCHDGQLENRVRYDPDFQGIALPESICDYFGRPIWLAKFKVTQLINENGKWYEKDWKASYAWYNDKMGDHKCKCGHKRRSHIFEALELNHKQACGECNCKQYEQRICDLPLGTTKALGLDLKQGLWRVKLELIG